MCDTFVAVRSATLAREVLFGKNSDREHDEAQYIELIPAARHEPGSRVRLTYKEIPQVAQTHSVLISRPHWIWGAEIGANARGLVIGNQAIFSKIPAAMDDGIIGMDYLRLALERAGSVDEAIQVITTLLQEHGQSGNCGFRRGIAYHNSFILADPNGAKVLETVDREWVATPAQDYRSISNVLTVEESTECGVGLEQRAIERGFHAAGDPFSFKAAYQDESKAASGEYRWQRTMCLLGERAGRLAPIDFFRFLRDHVEGPPQGGRPGPRICFHARENPLGQTTASWVASLAPGKIVHWVTGTAAPCTGLFKPVFLEAGVPDYGTRPGADPDGTSLWWRHERLRNALDRSDEATRGAFVAERDAIETRFLQEVAGCPPINDLESREQARRISELCWREALAFESRWLDRFACRF